MVLSDFKDFLMFSQRFILDVMINLSQSWLMVIFFVCKNVDFECCICPKFETALYLGSIKFSCWAGSECTDDLSVHFDLGKVACQNTEFSSVLFQSEVKLISIMCLDFLVNFNVTLQK